MISKLITGLKGIFTTKNLLSYLLLLIFTLVTQNIYLNIETLEWDIASYLVASQGLQDGTLPNELQWESKGPIFIYMYHLFSLPAENMLVIFKLINDIMLFIVSVILFQIIISRSKDTTKALLSSLLFLMLMSQVWAQSGYSELYSLLFMSLAYYVIVNHRYRFSSYIIIGLLYSLSTLINQGTVIFIIAVLLSESVLNNKRNYLRKMTYMGIGFVVPHLLFLVFYLINGLLDVYLATFLTIPFGYIQAQYSSFYELFVFSRELLEFNFFLYFTLLSFLVITFLNYLKPLTFKIRRIVFDFENLNIFFGLLFYFVGSHNYYHHLIFLMFYLTFLVPKLQFLDQKKFVYILIFISSISIFQNSFKDSLNNLSNIEIIQQDYPLYKLSQEIDSYFTQDYEVLAFDYNLILYYLDKPNFSYIVHPSNHFEEFIVSVLSDLNRIDKNYISVLIEKEPDVIICNPRLIIRGVPTEISKISSLFNCEVSDYNKKYTKIDTSRYTYDESLNYYFDPYREINVFIKNG